MRILVLACGASGIKYTDVLLRALKSTDHRVELMYSPNAKVVGKYEGVDVESWHELVDVLHEYSLSAPPCSGSYRLDVTIAIPCSVKTMCSTAYGIVGDPISRALFVSIKERRRTVIVFRETPMTLSMVECIRRLLLEGAIVSPASPGFYVGISDVEEMMRFFVQRVLDRAGIELEISKRRGSQGSPPSSSDQGSRRSSSRGFLSSLLLNENLGVFSYIHRSTTIAWNSSRLASVRVLRSATLR